MPCILRNNNHRAWAGPAPAPARPTLAGATKPPRARLVPENVRQAVKWRRQGIHVEQIAAHLGCAKNYVYAITAKYGPFPKQKMGPAAWRR